jgi:hypothetical protein
MPAKVAKHFTFGAQFKRFQQNPKEKAPKMLALLAPESPPSAISRGHYAKFCYFVRVWPPPCNESCSYCRIYHRSMFFALHQTK